MLQTNMGAAPVNYTYSPGTPPTVFGPDVCMEVDSQASPQPHMGHSAVARVTPGLGLCVHICLVT